MQQNKTRRRSRDGILRQGRKRRGGKITESHVKDFIFMTILSLLFFSQSSSLVLIGSFLMSCARCAFTGRMCSRDTCMTRRRRKKALTRMAGFTRGTWGNGNQWVSLSNSVLSQGLQFPNIHAKFGGNIFTILRQKLGSLHNFKSEI